MEGRVNRSRSGNRGRLPRVDEGLGNLDPSGGFRQLDQQLHAGRAEPVGVIVRLGIVMVVVLVGRAGVVARVAKRRDRGLGFFLVMMEVLGERRHALRQEQREHREDQGPVKLHTVDTTLLSIEGVLKRNGV